MDNGTRRGRWLLGPYIQKEMADGDLRVDEVAVCAHVAILHLVLSDIESAKKYYAAKETP